MGRLGKMIGAALGFGAANVAGVVVRNNAVVKEMGEHENDHNSMHTLLFGKSTVNLTEEINNSYLTCFSGSMTVNVPEPINGDFNIDVCVVLGNVTLNLPAGADVYYDGIGRLEKIRDIRTKDEGSRKFKVRINRKCYVGQLTIDCVG